MPFMQMENISHFLRACEEPPLNLPAHDRFLTVDLYESKDPAQVLQCLGAFSRVAHQLYPNIFKTTIGPKRSGGISPQKTGETGFSSGAFGRNRGLSSASPVSNSAAVPSTSRALSPALTGGSNSSRATEGARSPPASVSSWSKKEDQGATAPAWNIAQYGYMGGASQGNQGIAFGARRQITSASPYVPSLAEKERKRREKEEEEARLRQLAEEAEEKRRIERQAEEERARAEEERRWEEEARRQREEEKRRVEEQKRQWEEEERKWKMEEEARQREDAGSPIQQTTIRKGGDSHVRLEGQYLSQYRADQKAKSRQSSYNDPERLRERERVAELERQLEEAKERERQYLMERDRHHHEENHPHDRSRHNRSESRARSKSRARSRSRPRQDSMPTRQESNASWAGDEREYLRQQHAEYQRGKFARPLPEPNKPSLPSRPLPDPLASSVASRPLPEPTPPSSSRPLPSPSDYSTFPGANPPLNRTERFLANNPAPVAAQPRTYQPAEMGMTSESERKAEDARRVQSQQKTKAGGWASKSLLEREMERERERQREWEDSQRAMQAASRDANEGTKPGQSWDVNQYGYMGGDNQTRSGPGIGIAFGGRRQIIGPRPLGGPR
ncbi:hypothetical protein, variant [Verruconis gallopava]|nr:hypothetical protein, variant [Verruconis gallopava]KIW07635.1 hypothetical protein, variant [Verruconis gallopava]